VTGHGARAEGPPLLIATPTAPQGLATLERQAIARGLLLRLKVGRRLGLWTLRVGVARRDPQGVCHGLGELTGWAYGAPAGLHLETLRVQPGAPADVALIIGAATALWALEATPCRRARILAIHDGDRQHRRLVRYFRGLGFRPMRVLGGSLADLPLRLIWGGAGLLMEAHCVELLGSCQRRLEL